MSKGECFGRAIGRASIVATAIVIGINVGSSSPAFAQSAADVEALRQQIRTLQDRLDALERAQRTASPPTAVPAAPPMAPRPGEREITMERGSLLETIGLPRLEAQGTRVTGFLVGSFSYNSKIQMVPEFAGGAQALANAKSTNFRFDKFGLSLTKSFAPWLFGSASVEVESHKALHSHGRDPAFACPGTGTCIEQFGAETPTTEASLDKFNLTAIAPIGNGLSLSIGRFGVPFGMERHDPPLNLAATTSEIFTFGKPQNMTGFQASYQFTPQIDTTGWFVNRWESETTETPFDDNNKGKSIGGRIGFTPFPGQRLLSFGIGGWWGAEQDNNNSKRRSLVDVDATWTPLPNLLLAGEFIYGWEDGVSFRERGIPFAAPAVVNQDVKWRGFSVLGHYDPVEWFGLSLRYGYFDDQDASRTGVKQKLQSVTVAPIFHLSRLIPDLRPPGVTYARTSHPINWVDLRVEYRYNFSNKSVFSDLPPATDILNAGKSSHQLQVQTVVNF